MIERGALLGAAALVVLGGTIGAVVSLTWQQTEQRIATNERNYQLRALNEILPASRYDNPLFDDTISVLDKDLLGKDDAVTVYRARKNGAPVAVIIPVVAPRGYSGPINLLVGINVDGTIAGVRAASHRETQGLGDTIELSRSNWILGFDGRSIGDPPPDQWLVKADGGAFDQFTGATITPRAVVGAVRDALLYFNANREQLFLETFEQ